MGFAESDLGKLRAAMGHRPLLVDGARQVPVEGCEAFLMQQIKGG